MKRSALLTTLVAGALLLTGCSVGGSGSSDSATGGECVAPGAASDAIVVEGEGEELALSSGTPVESDAIERTVITEGEGESVADGEQIAVAMTYFNGSTGDVVQQAPETPVVNSEEQLAGWAYDAVRCASPGQRVAMVIPAQEVLGASPEEAGITDMEADDSFVIVMDFGETSVVPAACDISVFDEGTLLAKAEGTEKKAPSGFPAVELDADGAPTITMPEGEEPPTELSIATIIEGDGAEVQPGDCVAVNYRGVIWETGEEFDSSWSRGAATAFSTDGVIGGFKEALEGQKVGSQVISVVPAEDGGYGAAQLEGMGHAPDAVMVFVLDIVGVNHADEAAE